MNWEMCEVFPTRKAGSSHLCMQGTAETYKGRVLLMEVGQWQEAHRYPLSGC